MSSANRAERRRQERAAKNTRTLYHGTAGAHADAIRRDGLRVGQEGRVFLTDNAAIARSYATWEAAHHAPHTGLVITVRTAVPVTVEQHSFPPPLPWETTMRGGVSYFTTEPIAPDAFQRFDLFEIAKLREPDQLAAVRRESQRVCAALPRGAAVGNAAPMIRRSTLHKAIPDHWALLDAIRDASPNARSRWHGEQHWLGVTAAAVRILERGSPADPVVLLAFCLLHDSQRRSEGRDPNHGERAAEFADSLRGKLLRLGDGHRRVLRRALTDHDRGKTSSHPTIGACWDADRLTLPRVGITVDPRKLSTAVGRELAAERGAVPDPAACDWDWALSRMFLLAADRARIVAAAAA